MRFSMLFILVISVATCGQKGPLQLPQSQVLGLQTSPAQPLLNQP